MSRNLPAQIDPEASIVRVRGQAVILDADLAKLYGVETRTLNQQVKRNKARFPEDFVFQLTASEADRLRSQNVTASGRGMRSQNVTASKRNIRYLPYAFTEHGAIQAANVVKSKQAVQMSVAVVRAFVKLRRMALSVEALARKVAQLEKKYDKQFQGVFQAIRQLMAAPPTKQVDGFSKS